MSSDLDVYRESFRARCLDAEASATHAIVDEPGLLGMTPVRPGQRTMLLATDDRGYESLRALLPGLGHALIRVLPAAGHCAGLLDEDPGLTVSLSIAMLHPALTTLQPVALPPGFSVCTVPRGSRARDGPTLRDALRAASVADPSIVKLGSEETVLAQLRAMPASYRFYGAVDADGTIGATAAGGRFDRFAAVSFITTLPELRGRGLATALTAHALIRARADGSTSACLEASDAGRPIYRRLGFEELCPVRAYVR